ncbi:MAG: hypothetical protein ACREUR_11185, partial [Nitrosospira sp.]
SYLDSGAMAITDSYLPMTAAVYRRGIILNPVVGRDVRFLGCRARRNDAECDRAARSSASRRKVRPRSGMRAPQSTWNAVAASPTLPGPRFAGPLGRRFGALFHSRKLQRSHVPQKLCNSLPIAGLTRKVSVK